MGIVYRAQDTLLERVVALKVIASAIGENPELRERFFREARAAGQLSHRNVITIHDLGEHEGQPYLAMEYLTGEDLQRRLARPEPMSLGRKLEIAAEICDGLSYAHRRGVIHRDIKPANVFITDEGVVKILDFGLARMVATEVTASNMMLGTLNYMAPEQVRGERTDSRCDIFSFGVVLYEMLSGRKAFQGDSYATTLYKILQEVPEPLPQIDATLPPELVRIVEKAIAKRRDERYQDLTELAVDLALLRQTLSGGEGRPPTPLPALAGRTPTDPPRPTGPTTVSTVGAVTPAPAPAGPRIGTRWIGAAALAILAAAALGGWVLYRGQPDVPDRTAARVESGATTTPPPSAPVAEAARPDAAPATKPAPAPDAASRESADEARDRMTRAKNAARAAGSAVQRSAAYPAAIAAEREALRLYRAGDWSKAAARFYEATDLFRSAELGAATRQAPPVRAESRPETRPVTEPSPAPPDRPEPGAPATPPAPAGEAKAAPAAQPQGTQPAPPAPPSGTGTQPGPAAPSPTETAAPPQPSPPARGPEAAPLPPVTRPEAVTPSVTAKPPAPAVNAEDGVRELLRRYQQALESRSIDALRRVWPSLSGSQEQAIRNEFTYARRIEVSIDDVEIVPSGATAAVTFVRRYRLLTVDGQHLLRNSRTTMTASRRAASDWIIERIRFEAMP